jgi:hypothetical protein
MGNKPKVDKSVEMATKTKKEIEDWLQELDSQPEFIVGYQIMSDGKYGGEYFLPNNKDKLEVHVPQNITLVKPPDVTLENYAPYWDFVYKTWEVRMVPEEIGGIKPTKPIKHKELSEEEKLKFLPLPEGTPQPNEHGRMPITVLSEDKTRWVWKYPED